MQQYAHYRHFFFLGLFEAEEGRGTDGLEGCLALLTVPVEEGLAGSGGVKRRGSIVVVCVGERQGNLAREE